jgi:hypothetical protein
MNKNSRTLRRKFFQKKIPIYRKNPVLFAQEVLLFEPDDWQKQALMDLAESPKVAIKSEQVWKLLLCCGFYAVIPIRELLQQLLPNSSCTMYCGPKSASG